LCDYGEASAHLAAGFACFVKRLATQPMDPGLLGPLLDCRLVALAKPGKPNAFDPDQCSSLRPVGIGEAVRRLACKVVIEAIGTGTLQNCFGPRQFAGGMPGGAEAAVHVLREAFAASEVLFKCDGANGFNSIFRLLALHNARVIAPVLATALRNVYQQPATLHIRGGAVTHILSEEGSTQGDPFGPLLFMAATVPLEATIHMRHPAPTSVQYMDDPAWCGGVTEVAALVRDFLVEAPKYGFNVKAGSMKLLVKPEALTRAREAFASLQLPADCIVDSSVGAIEHLGAFIGAPAACNQLAATKVGKVAGLLGTLVEAARLSSHAAYQLLTHGALSRLTYLTRSTPLHPSTLQPAEAQLRLFIDALGVPQHLRPLCGLPIRFGGLGIPDPTALAVTSFETSREISSFWVNFHLSREATTRPPLQMPSPELAAASRRAGRTRSQTAQHAHTLRVVADLPDALRRRVQGFFAEAISPTTATRSRPSHGLGNASTRSADQAAAAHAAAATLLRSLPPEAVICYTDGSALNNPGPCGAAAVVHFPDMPGDSLLEESASLGLGTNQIGELFAIHLAADILAQKATPPEAPIHILTDSQYVVGLFAGGWQSEAHRTLVGTLKERLAHWTNISFHWVGGHTGLAGNERADTLANAAAHRAEAVPPDARFTTLVRASGGLLGNTSLLPGLSSSNWLSSISTTPFGGVLPHRMFLDLIHMRYLIQPPGLSGKCACGGEKSLVHASHCAKGGLVMLRHNAVRNLLASWGHQLGPTVMEPELTPVEGRTFSRKTVNTADEARSDVLLMEGIFGSSFRMAFIDVLVIAQEAPSHASHPIESVLRDGEVRKTRQYSERVREIEGGDFVPFVATDAGLLAPQAHHLLQLLADRIATKRGQPYADVLRCMRTQLSFCLARCSIQCLRAPRHLSQLPPMRFTTTSASFVAHLARLRRSEASDH
jgi:ribonuclease HI